jgi:AraC-like DNA-binding protein
MRATLGLCDEARGMLRSTLRQRVVLSDLWGIVVRTQHDFGKVKYQERKPHPILESTVRCLWTHERTYSADTIQSITPDGCVELIFNFGSPYLLLTTTPPCVLPTAILVGFQKQTMPIKVDGTVKVVAARLFAWGALALLEDEIRVPCDSVTALGADWSTLVLRLRNEVTEGRYEEAATTLESFLIQKALVAYDPKLVRTAAKLLYHTNGQCRVEDLADYCHASVRQIQRGFQSVVGASPKLFARILRFEQAQRRLMTDAETELTGLAHDCGYFDQATSSRSFGRSPARRHRNTRARCGNSKIM